MKNILFIVSGMLMCIAILITIFLLIKYSVAISPLVHIPASTKTSNSAYKILQDKPTINCAQSPLSTGCGPVDTSINICTKQYPNYPLLASILTTPVNRNLGVYSGKITNINYGQHTITVISQTNNQLFTFQSDSVNNVLYDIHISKINNFNTLQTGMKAVISFPCTQKLGSFILNQFQLVQ